MRVREQNSETESGEPGPDEVYGPLHRGATPKAGTASGTLGFVLKFFCFSNEFKIFCLTILGEPW